MVARSGLALTTEQRVELFGIWPAVQAMLDRNRTPPSGTAPLSAAAASAEPAIIFDVGAGE